MNKVEKFKKILQEVLFEIEKEKNNPKSIWKPAVGFIECEICELLSHAQNGEVYFKYGKKQRMLESTYFMTDTFEPVGKTILGEKILEVQKLYDKL